MADFSAETREPSPIVDCSRRHRQHFEPYGRLCPRAVMLTGHAARALPKSCETGMVGKRLTDCLCQSVKAFVSNEPLVCTAAPGQESPFHLST